MADRTIEIMRQLLKGACADSVHDFKIPRVVTRTKSDNACLGDVLEELPDEAKGGFVRADTEHEMLRGILSTPAGVDNPIRHLVDEISAGGGSIVKEINGIEKYTYTIKMLGKDGVYNMRNISNRVTLKDYSDFFGLRGINLNLVIDAQSIGLKKLFSRALQNEDGTGLNVRSIINREVINDPATKIYDGFEKSENRASFFILLDNYSSNIKYSSYDTPDDSMYRSKFFSKLDLTLSRLENNAANKLPRITLDITNKKHGLIYKTGNPHIDNSISSCWALIKKWFSSKSDKHIRCSTFFQCKRSGDWLQSLSCLDNGRPYILNKGGLEGEIFPGYKKLVTLDQILLWYSLFIGIDVIFTCTIPPAGAAQAYVSENEDNDEDEDVFSEDVGNTKSQKILLYFTRSEPESPEEKLARYKAMALDKSKKDYNIYIAEYNVMFKSIVSEILKEIVDTFQSVIKIIEEASSFVKPISSGTETIIRLFWKLTSLDYNELIFPEAPDNIEAVGEIEILEKYLSECSIIDAVWGKIRSKEDILIHSNAYTVNEYYMKILNPFIVDRTGGGEGRGGLSFKYACLKSCEYLKFRLPKKYKDEMLSYLRIILDEVEIKWPSMFLHDTKYAIHYYIDCLSTEPPPDMIADLVVKYLKEKNTSEKIAILEENEAITDAIIEASVEDLDTNDTEAKKAGEQSEINEFNVLKNNHDDSEISLVTTSSEDTMGKTERELQEKTEELFALKERAKTGEYITTLKGLITQKEEAIQRLKNKINVVEIYRRRNELRGRRTMLAKYIEKQKQDEDASIQLLTEVKEDFVENNPGKEPPVLILLPPAPQAKIYTAIVNGYFDTSEGCGQLMGLLGVQKGGGGELSEFTRDEYAYIIFINYLDKLIECLNGYDIMGQSDYIFFEALARIVIASIKVNHSNYLLLLDTVFIEIPDDSWVDDFEYINNKDFKDCVRVAAYNVALQSVGLRHGPHPYDTYKGPRDIKIFENVKFKLEFDTITRSVKNTPFSKRKLHIISILENFIHTLVQPKRSLEKQVNSSAVTSMLKHMPKPVIDYKREYSNQPYLQSVRGGYKTRGLRRKRRNGSPRRKTLRKTRSNR